ncbi:MAG: molybdopterin-dependent oxidoreductase, partial [Anaerolineales bacterium]
RLRVEGLNSSPVSLSYEELLELPQSELVATLDCTVGWFTTQRWGGVRLADLLREAGHENLPRLVWLQAVAGYGHLFTPAEAGHILLATHVGGEALAHRHGFPLRAVVPSRRGWFWVKWLGQVRAKV